MLKKRSGLWHLQMVLHIIVSRCGRGFWLSSTSSQRLMAIQTGTSLRHATQWCQVMMLFVLRTLILHLRLSTNKAKVESLLQVHRLLISVFHYILFLRCNQVNGYNHLCFLFPVLYFFPDQCWKFSVTLKSKGSITFKGFMLEARKQNEEDAIGQFIKLGDRVRLLACSGSPVSSLPRWSLLDIVNAMKWYFQY